VVGNRILMSLGTTYTKKLTAWSVGSGLGCLDTGAVAAFTWYSVFLIERTDTAVVDVLCSLSATAPSMPTNYTKKRRIGSILTDWTNTGSLYFFSQDGNRFTWATKTTTLDVDTVAPGTNANAATLSVPNGVNVIAIINVLASGNFVYVSDGVETDEAPSNTVAPLGSIGTTGVSDSVGQVQVRTGPTQQIRYRASANSAVRIVTTGWIDRRGQE